MNNNITKRWTFFAKTFFIVILISSKSDAFNSKTNGLADAFAASRYRSLVNKPVLALINSAPGNNGMIETKTELADDPKYIPPVSNDIDATMEEAYGDDQAINQVSTKQAPDPYEGFNRAMFTFNDTIDSLLLKPIATFYNKIMPVPLNQGIHNIFFNINTLPTIANDLLQANFYQAANDMWRVGINTTIGIGGFFDVAEYMHLAPYTNDFGLTMGRWGYRNSNYIVLPFFGPNTIRDGLGIPVDYFAFSLYPYIEPPSLRYEVYGLGIIDKRAQLLKFQDVLEEASLDKYVFVRSAYLQRRAHQIEENDHRGFWDQLAAQKVKISASTSMKNYD